MKTEYETIVASGLDLQLDCPDLALSDVPAEKLRVVRRGGIGQLNGLDVLRFWAM